jgi:hypothetical protein
VEMAVRSKLAKPDEREATGDRPRSRRTEALQAQDSDTADGLADTSAAASSDDDEVDLDALLAGLGGSDDAPADGAPASDAGSSDIDDLDALLASLNDDTSAEAPSEAAASDSDTDAELEALLKSLG